MDLRRERNMRADSKEHEERKTIPSILLSPVLCCYCLPSSYTLSVSFAWTHMSAWSLVQVHDKIIMNQGILLSLFFCH
jgi:hypothetical protein